VAISFNTKVDDQTAGSTVVINPASAAHDVIIHPVVMDATGQTVSSWPSGFTTRGGPQDTTTDSQTSIMSMKDDASGAEGSLTSTLSHASTIGSMLSYSGVDNTTPRDVAVVVANQNTGAVNRDVSASITPTTSGAWIVAIYFIDVTGSVNCTATMSTTAGSTGAWTQRTDIWDGGFVNCVVADAAWTSGTVTVKATAGTSATSAGGCLMLVALRPAGGGGGASVTYPQLERGILGALRGNPGRIN
jgi:hypothetical protein